MNEELTIRPMLPQDAPAVERIFNAAKAWFAANGIDQWQKGYPDASNIAADIASGNGFVACEGDRLLACFTFSQADEPSYRALYELDAAGSPYPVQWKTPAPYGAMHRVAVDAAYKGRNIGGMLVAFACGECTRRGLRSLRIDTYCENAPMRRMLVKNGFSYVGRLRLIGSTEDGDERLAYELGL